MLTIDGIVDQVRIRSNLALSFAEILDFAHCNDPRVAPMLDEVGDALGTLIALACNLSLQASLVLAGEGVAIFPFIASAAERTIARLRDPEAKAISIHLDDSGFHAWARGAASLAIQSGMARVQITR